MHSTGRQAYPKIVKSDGGDEHILLCCCAELIHLWQIPFFFVAQGLHFTIIEIKMHIIVICHILNVSLASQHK